MAKSNFRVCQHSIGDGHKTFVIAELGYNFNTLEEALQSVDAVYQAGCDAIKIQTFKADTITSQNVSFPQEAGGVNQYQEFKQYEISEEVHRVIFERARKVGLIPLSTPSHPDDVELLERVGIDIYKIGSDDVTNLPFIRYVARKMKPVILSSGMADLEEVEAAVQTVLDAGNVQVALLQCVSNYPIHDLSLVNIKVIETYKKKFNIPVGLSDHTMTLSAAPAAVGLGANIIEKHFALSKKLPAPDAFFSADPAELATLVKMIREVELMTGDGAKRPAATEILMRKNTRKSIIAKRSMKEGHAITEEDIIIKRPAWGIEPREWNEVLGKKTKHAIASDEPIHWENLL